MVIVSIQTGSTDTLSGMLIHPCVIQGVLVEKKATTMMMTTSGQTMRMMRMMISHPVIIVMRTMMNQIQMIVHPLEYHNDDPPMERYVDSTQKYSSKPYVQNSVVDTEGKLKPLTQAEEVLNW
ncbi:UNVERIFIED_CONTAM: hypothetical protein Slati_0874800 [Sesamum latifolium]|uniref:Uncharacterized protein n=1 Tax=Sesamum latifolium TaxID=2727402 RepID=A0AAW2XRH0_9LAMI